MVYRSKNLVNWSDPTKVYAIETDGWARQQNGAWAPEVHKYNGRYYLFTTLHNSQQVIATASTQGQACGNCGQVWQNQTYRATVIAVADSPMGPFTQLDKTKPVTPRNFMTLDGTLYMEDGKPWMVYAHEWIQKIDGTMEAIPLTDDLTAAAGDPIYLFKASDAPWYDTESTPNTDQMPPYVTDGPELYRTRNGDLIMLWTSYRNHNLEYVETWARSKSGKLAGPWEQMPPLITGNKGHAMIFWTFEGAPMLVLHNNMNQPNVRGEVYDVKFTGDGVKILRHREDIDGVAGVPPFPGESETQTTEDAGVGGSVPATLSLALGAAAGPRPVRPRHREGLHGHGHGDHHVERRQRDARHRRPGRAGGPSGQRLDLAAAAAAGAGDERDAQGTFAPLTAPGAARDVSRARRATTPSRSSSSRRSAPATHCAPAPTPRRSRSPSPRTSRSFVRSGRSASAARASTCAGSTPRRPWSGRSCGARGRVSRRGWRTASAARGPARLTRIWPVRIVVNGPAPVLALPGSVTLALTSPAFGALISSDVRRPRAIGLEQAQVLRHPALGAARAAVLVAEVLVEVVVEPVARVPVAEPVVDPVHAEAAAVRVLGLVAEVVAVDVGLEHGVEQQLGAGPAVHPARGARLA